MNHSLRITSIGALLAVLGLSACVVDRGEYRGNRYGARDRGTMQQRNGHDRDGRPCTGVNHDGDHDGDGHHDEDCRPRNH